jgi:hypothetical protein
MSWWTHVINRRDLDVKGVQRSQTTPDVEISVRIFEDTIEVSGVCGRSILVDDDDVFYALRNDGDVILSFHESTLTMHPSKLVGARLVSVSGLSVGSQDVVLTTASRNYYWSSEDTSNSKLSYERGSISSINGEAPKAGDTILDFRRSKTSWILRSSSGILEVLWSAPEDVELRVVLTEGSLQTP